MNYALSAYALSKDYQVRLETHLEKQIHYLILGELRNLSYSQLISYFRKLHIQTLFITLEEYGSQSLLPILSLIASLSTAKTIEIIYPNFSQKKISRFEALLSVINLTKGTLACWYRLIVSYFQLKYRAAKTSYPVRAQDTNKILYINANLWFGLKAGGAVGHISGVLTALRQKGYKIDYAAVDRLPLLPSNINFTLINGLKNFGLPEELNYFRFNQLASKQLLNTYQQSSLNFIYQRMSIANYTGAILSKKIQVPLILEYNGSEAWVANNWGRPLKFYHLAWQAEQASLEQAHLIVTISQALKDELIARGIPSEKIVFYPNCIDPVVFNPDTFSKGELIQLRSSHQLKEDSLVLSFVGTFGKWHGVDILTQAIHSLIEHERSWLMKYKIHFLLIGDGVGAKKSREVLANDNCKPFVTFTGLIPQHFTPRYLALSDILISPHVPNEDGSKFFGSPTKIFEYMAMGKGIIASRLEQIGDILSDSLNAANLPANPPSQDATQMAILCEPSNISELIKSMKFLVENAEWRGILGQNARKEALTKYTWQHHVQAFMERLTSTNTKI